MLAEYLVFFQVALRQQRLQDERPAQAQRLHDRGSAIRKASASPKQRLAAGGLRSNREVLSPCKVSLDSSTAPAAVVSPNHEVLPHQGAAAQLHPTERKCDVILRAATPRSRVYTQPKQITTQPHAGPVELESGIDPTPPTRPPVRPTTVPDLPASLIPRILEPSVPMAKEQAGHAACGWQDWSAVG